MSNPTDSPVWFITGAASGIGRRLAEQALASGARVVAAVRSPKSLEDLACRAVDSLQVVSVDMAEPASIRRAVEEAQRCWGRLDVVVNNAGYGLVGALEECGDDQIARNLATNLVGPLQLIRAVLPFLRAQRSGHLITLGAAAAIGNYPGFSVYGGAKAALEAVSESLRLELAPFGIRVTVVVPGPFRTDFIQRSLDRAAHRMPEYEPTAGKFLGFLERMNGRQPGDPERAAAAIVRMVSEGKAPMRLVLGKYAVDKTRKTLAARAVELAAWEAVGLGTDFPPT
ncbi:MAG: SDR family NAD(P)-dependent oxidoreductase [Verrucomicrobia bacterium]|nr:SDR family NAD(P)-dependent oxidoreductase [Verrucomicrobiota bacterium]